MDQMGDPRRGTGSSPGGMVGGSGGVGGGGGLGPSGSAGGGGSQQHHSRSRSATRTSTSNANRSYHSLDRDGHDREREFIPIRDSRDGGRDGRDVRDVRDVRGDQMMRDRSLERGGMVDGGGGGMGGGRRDRSMDRNAMMDEEMLYGGGGGGGGGGPGMMNMNNSSGLAMPRSARQSPAVDMAMKSGGVGMGGGGGTRESYLMEMQAQNSDLSRELNTLKRELEMTNQKLGSSMHSIKTFWSPELKKERALRKEESAKYSLINDQLKLLNAENQVSRFLQTIIIYQ